MAVFDPEIHNPMKRYLAAGNHRPSVKQLESIYSRLRLSPKPAVLLACADVCIDLSTATPSLADAWLDASQEMLDSVCDQANLLQEAGCEQAYDRAKPSVLRANLRKNELKQWKQATQQVEVENDYRGSLEAVGNLVDLAKGYSGVRTDLIEYMPLLLGARGIKRQQSAGWLGRMALCREDKKPWIGKNINPNWDSGASLDNEPDHFLKPPLRMQIMAGRSNRGKSQLAKNSGIIPLRASILGFADPIRIIESCLAEEGMTQNGSRSSSTHLLGTNKLNAIADQIASRFEDIKIYAPLPDRICA